MIFGFRLFGLLISICVQSACTKSWDILVPMQAPNPVLTPGTPCFPRQMTMTPHTPTPVTYQNLTVWSLSCMEYWNMICFALAHLVIEYVRFNYLMQRFPAPVPVPGIPPHHAMYKLDPGGIGVPGQSGPQPLVDFQPVSTSRSLSSPASPNIPAQLNN